MRFPAFDTPRQWWIFYALCALSFLPALGLYYVGEEAIAFITSFEMWHKNEWFDHTIYGNNAKHNPLFNWLHIPLASAMGLRAAHPDIEQRPVRVRVYLASAAFKKTTLLREVVFTTRDWVDLECPLPRPQPRRVYLVFESDQHGSRAAPWECPILGAWPWPWERCGPNIPRRRTGRPRSSGRPSRPNAGPESSATACSATVSAG